MSGFNDAASGMAGPLLAGLQVLSVNQSITFTRYVRYVLPLDGYVFWLKTEQTSFAGSLHVGITKQQNEDETVAVNRVVFTSGTEVQQFNAISPTSLWVGTFGELRFAFSRTGLNYKASDGTPLYHYEGTALYPALASQLVDVGSQLSQSTLVVSDSLPIWLQLYSYNPIWVSSQIPNPFVQLFPSFAVPDNIVPPYGTVHIAPESTRAIQAFPQFDSEYTTQWQLVSDRVRVTLYGLTNDQAYNFVSLVNQFSVDTNLIGMMDIVAIRDEKRTQPELGILAMKKTLDYTVSYNQQSVRTVAQALIETAAATVIEQTGSP